MSSLKDHGLFASRKRRSPQSEGLKDEVGRPALSVGTRETPDESRRSRERKSAATGAAAGHQTEKPFVQEAIHKEVQFEREGSNKVPENTMIVFRFVKKNYIVPTDFDKDHKFGPLSGVSHELRVVSAFMAGQLEKRFEGVPTKMCLECGRLGHFPRHCPLLLE